MERAGDILKNFLLENGFNNDNSNFKIFRDWEFIIGQKIYGHSRIIDIVNHTLIIEVDHPGWLQLMILKEKEILKRIKQKYPELEIKLLKYQFKFTVIKKNDKVNKKNDIIAANKGSLKKEIQDIKHLELKKSLDKLYNSVLNNQRRVDKKEELE